MQDRPCFHKAFRLVHLLVGPSSCPPLDWAKLEHDLGDTVSYSDRDGLHQLITRVLDDLLQFNKFGYLSTIHPICYR
jgi:hypothetical protein